MNDTYVIAMPVDKSLHMLPGSAQRNCGRCAAVVWVDTTNQARLRQGVKLICLDCFSKDPNLGAGVYKPLTERQRQELQQYLARQRGD